MLAERIRPSVNRTQFGTARCSRERIHKFCNSFPASTFSSSVDPLADRTTARSSPIDRKQVPYQTHDHTVCFYLIGISDEQLRAANYHLSSSVRFMPLSSYGPAWSWNADGQAQIFTVICGGELHGRGIAKTNTETCGRRVITRMSLASPWLN
jgi:hypothetical protein